MEKHSMGSSKVNPVPPRPLPSQVVKDDEPFLVAAAKAGDISAFETLVGRYERKIFRLTQNITQNREDAEDAMQEAFLKAFEHLGEFQGNSRFYTWLVRIAVNQALMKLRKRRPNQVSLDEEVDTGEDMMPREVEDWGPSPEERYEQTEMAQILSNVIGELDPCFPNRFPAARHRRIVHRRDGGGAGAFGSCCEIAAVAGPAEIAPEAESIFSARRKFVKCKGLAVGARGLSRRDARSGASRSKSKSISPSARIAASS